MNLIGELIGSYSAEYPPAIMILTVKSISGNDYPTLNQLISHGGYIELVSPNSDYLYCYDRVTDPEHEIGEKDLSGYEDDKLVNIFVYQYHREDEEHQDQKPIIKCSINIDVSKLEDIEKVIITLENDEHYKEPRFDSNFINTDLKNHVINPISESHVELYDSSEKTINSVLEDHDINYSNAESIEVIENVVPSPTQQSELDSNRGMIYNYEQDNHNKSDASSSLIFGKEVYPCASIADIINKFQLTTTSDEVNKYLKLTTSSSGGLYYYFPVKGSDYSGFVTVGFNSNKVVNLYKGPVDWIDPESHDYYLYKYFEHCLLNSKDGVEVLQVGLINPSTDNGVNYYTYEVTSTSMSDTIIPEFFDLLGLYYYFNDRLEQKIFLGRILTKQGNDGKLKAIKFFDSDDNNPSLDDFINGNLTIEQKYLWQLEHLNLHTNYDLVSDNYLNRVLPLLLKQYVIGYDHLYYFHFRCGFGLDKIRLMDNGSLVDFDSNYKFYPYSLSQLKSAVYTIDKKYLVEANNDKLNLLDTTDNYKNYTLDLRLNSITDTSDTGCHYYRGFKFIL